MSIPVSSQAVIVATLEEPHGSASGIGMVRGWAFSTAPGAKIDAVLQVTIDGNPSIEAACCTSRNDVAQAFPGNPGAQRSGFAAQFNWGLLAPGSHQVCIQLRSSAGESETRCKTVETHRVGDLTFLSAYQFSENSQCSFYNDSPAASDASFECTHMLVTRQSDGKKFECSGSVVFSWDKVTQTFKQTSSCG